MAFAALEQVDQEEPDLLHPLGRRAHLAIEVLVGLIQRPGEGLELLPGGGDAAPELPQQGRVRDGPSADHHRVDGRKVHRKDCAVLHGHQIPVVAQGIPAALRRPGEPVPVHGPLVELLLHPGVDGEAGDGITVVNVQQPLELLRLLHPQPGLDGHR